MTKQLTLRQMVKEAAMALPYLALLVKDLMVDARVPMRAKLVLGGVALYLANPFDLIPDWIPVLGQLDDIGVMVVVLDGILNQVDESLVREHWRGSVESLNMMKDLAGRYSRFIPQSVKAKLFRPQDVAVSATPTPSSEA